MGLVGRSAEVGELAALLDRAAAGFGGVITLVGAAGSGKSALAAEAAALARDRGFEVAGGSAVRGRPGRLVWAGLLDDLGADPEVTRALFDGPGPLGTTMAVRLLTAGNRRLIVVDDVDAGGQEAVDMLALVAARLVTCSTAVVATAATSLGVGRDLKLCGLSERDLAAIVGEMAAGQRHAVWVASRGMPGIARTLAGQLADLPPGRDALVHLALHAAQRGEFLGVDDGVVRLIEMALARAADDASRARLLARLSRELLGDPLAGPRRRALADEALMLAGRAGDGSALAEVLDARLYALWDPAGAQDRLDAASELIRLGQEADDGARERDGLFWRFVAMMELARVDEAEVALAAFERAAVAAGDAEAAVMALSRHGMLAILRGRFEAAAALAGQVSERARRIGMPDAERLTMAVRGLIDAEQGDERSGAAAAEVFDQMARRFPGHLYEATLARILAALGRTSEAAALLERLLPQTLAASGPRWLGAVTDLSAVAAEVGGRAAAARLYEALLPYQGRLVIWGGANAVNGPASHYLGLLAARLGRMDDAVAHFEDAIGLAERTGARPALARGLVELGEALTRRGGDGDARRAADLLRRGRGLAGELGLAALIRRLAAAPDEWSLRPAGDGWLLRAGPEHARLADSRGVRQLRTLLASPRRGIPALDLAAGGPGLRAPAAPPVLDAAAAASYRRRLGELTAELDAADAAGDSERASRAEAERQWLLAELRRATGLGGRARRATNESERARVNVTRTLRAVIGHVGAAAPQAGAYLQASVRTGLECRYDPARAARRAGACDRPNESFGRAERLLRDSQNKEATMNNGAANHAVTHPVTPAQIKVAGLAGDLYGSPDGRPPLVLLNGLTYGRGIWQPVLGHLGRIDPGRQVLNLDLPGHGDSPDQLPHTMERIVGLVHEATGEAGLAPPVLAGHSQSGGFASVYAAQYPVSGVINVEASPDLWTLVQVIQGLAASCGGDVLEVWRKMEQTFGLHLLPAETREFIMRHSRPRRDLLASYWEDIFAMTPEQASAMVNGAVAAITAAGVSYLLILGSEPSPDTAAWFENAAPHATVEVWADSGHFPHIAHPARFAERLAATA